MEEMVEKEQVNYDSALTSLQTETKEFQDKKEKLETELIGLRKDEDEKKSKMDIAEGQVNILKSNEQKVRGVCILLLSFVFSRKRIHSMYYCAANSHG